MSNSIYLALDFPDWQTTGAFIDNHELHGIPVKVGMELFYKEGVSVIEKLKENGHPIFLDLKLHDIPTTVNRAMQNLAKLEVDIVNVHALGGSEMIKQAKEGLLAHGGHHETKLIAVTILTSMDEQIMSEELTLPHNLRENVSHFATLAERSGADGVVCSVHEASAIKSACKSPFLTVTPGIRLHETNHNDQKRIATPAFARRNNADMIVIGRSVTRANDSLKAYEQAVKEWENGLKH
ncbi:orotidine-5'-phosphate decarboxylase [Virgibacillus sp. W0181]|uniref:orotidine-5'-phosphate decarboxylase n=1 Tax=Virgibacillus sp. W0181 TaxID=3391581 RepID=UPI003F477B1C